MNFVSYRISVTRDKLLRLENFNSQRYTPRMVRTLLDRVSVSASGDQISAEILGGDDAFL